MSFGLRTNSFTKILELPAIVEAKPRKPASSEPWSSSIVRIGEELDHTVSQPNGFDHITNGIGD